MKTRSLVAILMVALSLASAAVANADVEVILLPSDVGQGLAGQEVTLEAPAPAPAEAWEETKTVGEEDAAPPPTEVTRPWECCNTTVCTKSIPPTCRCLDLVDRCDGACKKCEPSMLVPFRLVCNDEFHGEPGPKCPKDDDVPVPSPSGASPSLPAAAQSLLAFAVLLLIQIHY